jgi:hypothetical protein
MMHGAAARITFLIATSVVVVGGPILVWRHTNAAVIEAIDGPTIVSTSGAKLERFFGGLPSSPHVRTLYAKAHRQRGVWPRMQHFLGIAAVVHADPPCGGCNVSVADPFDCGCSTQGNVDSGSENTGTGARVYPACESCSAAEQSITCEPVTGCD